MSPIGGFGNFSNFGNFNSNKINEHIDKIKEKGLSHIDSVTQSDEFKSSVGESVSSEDVSSMKTAFAEMMDSIKNFFGKLLSFFSSFNFGSLNSENAQELQTPQGDDNDDYRFNVPPKREGEEETQTTKKPLTAEERSMQQVYDTPMTRENAGELRAERANIENQKKNNVNKQQVYDTPITRENAGEIRAEKENIKNDENKKKADMQEKANEVAKKVIENTKPNKNSRLNSENR